MFKNLPCTASHCRESLAPPPVGFMTARQPELPHASRKDDGGAADWSTKGECYQLVLFTLPI